MRAQRYRIDGRSWRAAIVAVVAGMLMVAPARAGVVAIGNSVVDWSAATLTLPPRASFELQSSLSEADVTYFPTPESDAIVDPSVPPTKDTSDDWGDTAFTASLLSGNLKGSAATSAEVLRGDALISLVGENGQGAFVGGHFVRQAKIFLLEAGTVSFSVPYKLDLQLSTTRDGELALGILLIDFFLVGLSPDSPTDVESDVLAWTVTDGETFKDSKSGTITLEGTFKAGETVGLSVDGFAYVEGYLAMPAPGGAPLLLAALAGLAWLRRRRG